MRGSSTRSTARRAAAAAALLGVLAVVGTATVALGASGPATPVITSGPANPTASTSATFTFSAAPSGGSNQCKVDAGAFAACAAPETYTGLAGGSHTFQVRAVDNKGKTSSPASYTWTIDTTAPSVVSINRVGGSPTNASSVSWTVTFSEPVTGVSLGAFSLDPTVTGASLSTVSGSGAAYTVAASTGSGDGTLTLRLANASGIRDLALNPLGAPIPFIGQAYAIDKTPPATPTITSGPEDPTPANFADPSTFGFTGEAGSAFRCSIDGAPATACTSPKSYSGLGQGLHTFSVVAVDSVGNVGPAAAFNWTIVHPVKNFTISGNATAGLYPGLWVPIAITISNDNNYPIHLVSLTVTATGDSTPPGCPPNVGQGANANLEFQQSNVSYANPLFVPGKGSVTIPVTGAVSRPQVRLTNAAFNQDVCKTKSFTLTYQGLASK
jgi:hypothetical protein